MNIKRKQFAAAGLAAILVAAPIAPRAAMAMPIGSPKAAAHRDITEVRWRGHGGGWVAGGVAAGLALGAIAASRPYYYSAPYYAPPAYYAPPVYDAPPVYVEPDNGPSYYDYGYDSTYSGPQRERQLNGKDY